MNRLTWEDKDGGMFVDGSDCYELELEGCVTVCSGEAIIKLAKYEDVHEKLENRISDIKSSTNYPHDFTGQMVEDLEWVLNQLD